MHLPRRFDNALMQPPDAGPGASGANATDTALLASLHGWCEDRAIPLSTEPLRVASIAPHPGLDAAACALDGSHELARLGRWRGLLWRLQILGRELLSRGAAQPGEPWDCGWWRDGALGPAEAFQPRRPTLLMLREPDPATAVALLATLRARSPGYSRPLRVLWVSAAPVAGIARL